MKKSRAWEEQGDDFLCMPCEDPEGIDEGVEVEAEMQRAAADPGQPAIWTEDQGWFDKWGYGKRVRDPTDQIFGVARWFAVTLA